MVCFSWLRVIMTVSFFGVYVSVCCESDFSFLSVADGVLLTLRDCKLGGVDLDDMKTRKIFGVIKGHL